MTLTTPLQRLALTVALSLALLVGSACSTSGADDDTAADDTATAEAEAEGTATTDVDDIADTGSTREPTTGAGGGDADRQAYVDALTGSVADDDLATPEQAGCLAERWVDTVGVDTLRDAGIEPDGLARDSDAELQRVVGDEATAGAMYDQFGACGLDVEGFLLDLLVGDGDVTPGEQACMEDQLGGDGLRSWFVAEILGDDTVDDPFDLVLDCFEL